jgi:hypothetical protein
MQLTIAICTASVQRSRDTSSRATVAESVGISQGHLTVRSDDDVRAGREADVLFNLLVAFFLTCPTTGWMEASLLQHSLVTWHEHWQP